VDRIADWEELLLLVGSFIGRPEKCNRDVFFENGCQTFTMSPVNSSLCCGMAHAKA
jgi:hypothetical protein